MAAIEGVGGGEKKRVVVIGGGVAGSVVAKALQEHSNVVLIDSKEYFEVPWASLRSLVEPSFAERSVINHTEYLQNARLVISPAINVTESEVLTAQGDPIAYDYLVIATGHVDTGALARSEKLSLYHAEYEKIKSSNSILIVGGGPTGVELAGEVAVDFPDKKVTLVHRGSRLLEFIGHKAGRKALEWLTSKKVEVILGQSVNLNSVSDGVYQTSGGETITADCYFNCTGKPMGSMWLKDTVLKNSLDIHGRLMVDANLRVKGHKNVFGIGDITDIPEIKQGYLAQRHATVAAKNLKLLMTGGDEQKMAVYKPGWQLAIVSLGRNEAVAQVFFVTLIGCFPGMIKSKDLFVGKTRKQLGLKSNLL
ncbi:Apoptosis-inducing factor like [Actinidia chinensis var. chinensis]|uniref:Apoptosis-inducing factor like n=1 Tax=Actinidia chinensis var. chinensis TaxID=1590841 RepID=A0A2R6QAQ8_ACTCC|nr:Apoptosis-inducing factor like [Actinidia chinensis var. chinensis]